MRTLRVALFPETNGKKDVWVAQCLDCDLVAQGTTEEAAKESFHRTLAAHVFLSLRYGQTPFTDILAAEKPKAKEAIKGKQAMSASRVMSDLEIAFSPLRKAEIVPAM